MAAPYHLRTPKLDLFAPDPALAVRFLRAAQASVPALMPYMDWSHDLPDDEGIVALIRSWRALFDTDADRHYLLVERATGEVVGACGSHPRVRGKAREIGYWVRTDRAGRGLATQAASAVIRAEFELFGQDRIDIYVEQDNLGSLKVVEKLGFSRVGLLPGHISWAHGPDRDAVVSSLVAADYPDSLLRRVPVEAWDILGRPLSIA